LIKARFTLRSDYPPPAAEELIRHQIADLKQLPIRVAEEFECKGTIEVLESNIMPFGYFIHSGDVMLVGLMPPLSSYDMGPMIEVRSNSSLRTTLEENWRRCWAEAEKGLRPRG
jgi:hypothetical protein